MYHRPNWYQTVPKGDVNPFARYTRKAFNRSGIATVAGGLYQFDTDLRTAVETVANTKGALLPAVVNFKDNDDASAFRNVMLTQAQVTATNAARGENSLSSGLFGIANASVADNEELEMVIVGEVSAYIFSAINAGLFYPFALLEPIAPSATDGSIVPSMFVRTNAASTPRSIGRTLANFTNGAGTTDAFAALATVVFDGWAGFK
jgi:hypothetical protein